MPALIDIVSPSGALTFNDLEQGLQILETSNFPYRIAEHCFAQYDFGYDFAGTPEQRISDFNKAIKQPDSHCIWASRGGYGAMDLLGKLDINHLKKHFKWLVGYSDTTALHAYLNKNGLESIHGQAIRIPKKGCSRASFDTILHILHQNFITYRPTPHPFNEEGEVEGVIYGGNLSLICSLLGTNYLPDFQDAILFLEEVGEAHFRLDRMLQSLALAGIFDQLKGVIIGGMTRMGQGQAEYDTQSYQIIKKHLKPYRFLQVFHFPAGHVRNNKALILGRKMHLSVRKNKVEMIFN